ncbi:MAG: calcium/sodium antiporter [Lentisphaeraceae bacterium]|nr:calcium/sodium antiporter [Lentisphaeraceae bacterium]
MLMSMALPQEIPINIAFVIASVFLLWYGADWLVKGASKMALSMKIQPIVIGLTVVAFGTSAPELVVSILAANEGNPEIALGNVIGSNIANIALVLGICALIKPIEVHKDTLKGDLPFLVMVSFLAYVLARFGAAANGLGLGYSRVDGALMLGFLVYFLARIFAKSKKSKSVDPELQEIMEEKKTANSYNIFLVVIGIVFLVLGAKLLVHGGTVVATSFGVPKFFIALTMVALGTSLPELAASGMAAYRGETELCMGNIIGSNVMNLLIVLAVTVCIAPMPVDAGVIRFEFPAMIVIAIMLYFVCRLGSLKVSRQKGVLFLLTYVAFITFSYKNAQSSTMEPVAPMVNERVEVIEDAQ